jgi:hypothetical protein
MAIEFNITAEDRFFLGEDKNIEFTIFGPDNVTPVDVTGWTLEWNMRKTDKAGDPPLLRKYQNNGLALVGVFNANAQQNTQRVRITFGSDDTSLLKPMVYRHSLKRTDVGSESILSYGSIELLQATEH